MTGYEAPDKRWHSVYTTRAVKTAWPGDEGSERTLEIEEDGIPHQMRPLGYTL